MSHLLVIEDDEEIGELLRSSLALHGHVVHWERTGRGGLARAADAEVDLVLLDLGLPDLDGLEVCRQLRLTLPTTVIVMLTARAREMDVVVGLEVGADDYLVKPVPLAELVARVRAHLRRTEPAKTPATHHAGDLTVSVESRRATVDGHDLALRPREFDLLARLIVEPGSAVSRETLMSEVWDQHWYGSTKTLDVHVAALRRKLSETGRTVPQIVTVRGHGYRLENP